MKFIGRINWLRSLVLMIVILAVSGCSVFQTASPTATPLPPTATFTATQIPPTATLTPLPPTPTATASPLPTDTPTLAPTDTPGPTATNTPLPIPAGAAPLPAGVPNSVLIYFILEGTGGPAGCGDSAIAVWTSSSKTGKIDKDLRAALKALFSFKTKYVGPYYNPVYLSRLRVEEVTFDEESGLASVYLSGGYRPSGDPCDNTRVRDQIWGTIRQFGEIRATNIYLNGIPFGDFLANDK
jgi:hypothetical protein